MADALKAQGNAAFSSGKFQEAIDLFTQAIALDEGNHVLYSNRSACQASLERWDEALEDARKTVELKSDWAKGYSRLGGALHGKGDYEAAVDAYKQGLELDSNSAVLQKGLKDAEAAMKGTAPGGGSGLFGPDFLAKLAMDPETRPFLSQPDFQAMLQSVQSNPQMMSMYMQDPRFKKALMVGLGLPSGMDFSTTGNAADMSEAPAPASRQAPAPKPEPEPEPEPELTEEERAVKEQRDAALKEKEAGNAAYKKREFDAALAHYTKALELYDGDISFITNRAAVHFEMKQYEAAIADCELAVEKGREIRAEFKMIAKAMTRQGNCLIKLNRLEEAIAVLQKALTEHRNADTLKLLNSAERMLKQQQEDAYVDLEAAVAEKDAGNEAFKTADYPKAIAHYSEALKRGPPAKWPEAHKVFSNRAACYTKLGALPEGEKDADKCIELAPTFAKGYIRKAHVQFMMKEYEKAIETYETGLSHDPDNAELKDGILRCRQQINRFMSGMASEEEIKERQAKAMADPAIQNIMMDPSMQQVLKELGEDPKSASKHLQNPMIAGKLQKLMAAGIIRMG